jgi:hypothetical protein
MCKSLALFAFFTTASAYHSLDNNWKVKATGWQDKNGCFQLSEELEDLGLANLPFGTAAHGCAFGANDVDVCPAVGEATVRFPNKMSPSSASKAPCQFDRDSAQVKELTGYILDRQCQEQFVTGFPDASPPVPHRPFAPDNIALNTSTQLHTRGCLLVSYCSSKGFTLVTRNNTTQAYELATRFDQVASQNVYNYLACARGTPVGSDPCDPFVAGKGPPKAEAASGSDTLTIALVSAASVVVVAFAL